MQIAQMAYHMQYNFEAILSETFLQNDAMSALHVATYRVL